MLVESRVRGHSSGKITFEVEHQKKKGYLEIIYSGTLFLLKTCTAQLLAYVLNNILRRHFADMTEKFLMPLNRYFDQLLPTNISSSTLKKGEGQLKPFQSDRFYQFLKDNPPSLQFKSTFKARATTGDPVREFYTQFLKCGNFATWLRLRTNEAQNEVKHRYIQKLCDIDVTRQIASSREVEAVDLLVRFQDALHLVQHEDAPNTAEIEKLQMQIDTIIRTLPADLRKSLEH